MTVQRTETVICDGCNTEIPADAPLPVRIADPDGNGSSLLDFHNLRVCVTLWAAARDVARETALADESLTSADPPDAAITAVKAVADNLIKKNGGAAVAVTP